MACCGKYELYRFTTPTITFTLPFEVSSLSEAYMTIKQYNKVVVEKDISESTSENTAISWLLSQTETGSLNKGAAIIQLRCKGTDDKAYASTETDLEVKDVLKQGEI